MWFIGPSVGTRRNQIIQNVIGGLQRLAATEDIAVVVLSQCGTRVLADDSVALGPAINTTAWDHGMTNRLALFRDFVHEEGKGVAKGVRFAGIQKLNGEAITTDTDSVFAFDIGPVCLLFGLACSQ